MIVARARPYSTANQRARASRPVVALTSAHSPSADRQSETLSSSPPTSRLADSASWPALRRRTCHHRLRGSREDRLACRRRVTFVFFSSRKCHAAPPFRCSVSVCSLVRSFARRSLFAAFVVIFFFSPKVPRVSSTSYIRNPLSDTPTPLLYAETRYFPRWCSSRHYVFAARCGGYSYSSFWRLQVRYFIDILLPKYFFLLPPDINRSSYQHECAIRTKRLPANPWTTAQDLLESI